MPRIFKSPRIVVSRCIEIEPSRSYGDMITGHIVAKLKEFGRFYSGMPGSEDRAQNSRQKLWIVRYGKVIV